MHVVRNGEDRRWEVLRLGVLGFGVVWGIGRIGVVMFISMIVIREGRYVLIIIGVIIW